MSTTTLRTKHPDPVRLATLATLFQAVADPARASVILILGDGERHVGDIHAELGHHIHALSRSLAYMRLEGLIEVRRHGQRNVYTLTGAGEEMRAVIETLSQEARFFHARH